MQQITHLERRILDLYAQPFAVEERRIGLLRQLTGLGQAASLMLVSDLIETEHALAYSPTVVRRLLRHRDQRGSARRVRTVV